MPISASHWLLAGVAALAAHIALAVVFLNPLAGAGSPGEGGGGISVQVNLDTGWGRGEADVAAPSQRDVRPPAPASAAPAVPVREVAPSRPERPTRRGAAVVVRAPTAPTLSAASGVPAAITAEPAASAAATSAEPPVIVPAPTALATPAEPNAQSQARRFEEPPPRPQPRPDPPAAGARVKAQVAPGASDTTPKPLTPIAAGRIPSPATGEAGPGVPTLAKRGEPAGETGTEVGAGGAAADPGARAGYIAELQAWLERHKRYPERAIARREQGTATLYFVVDTAGRVLDYRLEKSSGHRLLDREVLAMIRRAAPLPRMPAGLRARDLTVILPVRFALR